MRHVSVLYLNQISLLSTWFILLFIALLHLSEHCRNSFETRIHVSCDHSSGSWGWSAGISDKKLTFQQQHINNANMFMHEFPLCHIHRFTLTQFIISAILVVLASSTNTQLAMRWHLTNIPTHLKWVYFCSWRPNALVDLTTQESVFFIGSDPDQDDWPQDHKT